MPIGFRSFRSIRTKLKLNGPKLRFTQDPQNATQQLDNTVVFTAEAIAEFPGAGVNADGGYGFSWYVDGNNYGTVSMGTNSGSGMSAYNNNTTPHTLGGRTDDTQMLVGKIAEARTYRGTLTSSQIDAEWQATKGNYGRG